ncbi:MAG: ankyrin repeat domain-containing protein [Rhodobacteraceae bacterium]|nr:ankyrin repeat domain-containing protein [Paracoccaceae bacterium]MCY4141061.1 ankyrin repeat domain-containing protein [Paracoccaceae bacterium]
MNCFTQRSLAVVAVAAFLAGACAPNGVAADSSQPDGCQAWNSDDSELLESFWSNVPPGFVLTCLETGADVGTRDNEHGATPLHWAAVFSQNPAVLTALIDAGANPGLKNDDGETPLDVALRAGRSAEIITTLRDSTTAAISVCQHWITENRELRTEFYRNLTPETVLACLETGADPNARRENGGTPLTSAVVFSENPAVIGALLDAGADPNVRNLSGWTPLHGAATFNGNPVILAVLLEAGADPTLKTGSGKTPLDLAIRRGRPAEIISALREALDAEMASASSHSFDCAGWNAEDDDGDFSRWRFYLNLTPEWAFACLQAGKYHNAHNAAGMTPLHNVAWTNANPAVLAVLLEAGADPHARDIKYDRTPLHYAALGNDNPDVILALVDAGADLSARNKYGGTPLHEAALGAGNPDVLTALVDAGADPHARDNDRGTPLHNAARYNGNPDVIPALADAGADLNARDDYGNTPLHEAVLNENPDVIFALVDAGARPPLKLRHGSLVPALPDYARAVGSSAEIIEAVRAVSAAGPEASVLAECTGLISGGSVFLESFYRNVTPEFVRTCLEAGVDPHASNSNNQTPLHSAALYSDNPAVIAALLDGGADPNALGNDRETPLHSAAKFSKNPAVVVVLLDAGADPNARSSSSYTPLHGAAGWNENPEIVAALLNAGANPALVIESGETPLDLAIGRRRPEDITALLEAAAEH